LNTVIIFCVPDLSYIDLGTRKLFHAIFETKFIDRKNNKVCLKVSQVYTNPRDGEVRYIPFR